MAIVGMEGFDYFQTSAINLQINDHINYSMQQPFLNTARIHDTGQRFGTGKYLGLYQNLNDFIINTSGTTITSTVYVSFAFKTSINLLYSTDFLIIYNQAVSGAHVFFRINPGGTITAWSGSSGALGQSTQNINLDTWYWVEAKVVVNNGAGTINLKVDGVDFLNLSGKITQSGASSQIGAIGLGGGPGRCFYDDLVWQDATGDYLGDSTIDTLLPVGNSSITWDYTGGATNYDCVNDIGPDVTIDSQYVYTSVNESDYYTYGTIPTDSAVDALCITYRASRDNTGPSSVTSNHTGTSGPGTTRVLTTDWVIYSDVFEDDGTSAWTQSSIDSTTFGIQDVT